ncbi:MAG TPA: hypothetical protein VLB51_02705 [Methylomirabilota bacterium]|nr:hypothetical protein [Methylomirabilota bacterium]
MSTFTRGAVLLVDRFGSRPAEREEESEIVMPATDLRKSAGGVT